MKRKLLTVLLAVVMVFGVFGLTACKGSNADADYNYYGVKYEIEDEVKIDAVTFQAVYKIFTTPGTFLLYVDSSSNKANYQAINKLANDWNVTIYHFNPELTGGYASSATGAESSNLCSDLTGLAKGSQLKAVQDLLLSISNKKLDDWKGYEGKLLAVTGADSTVTKDADKNDIVKYNGKVTAANSIEDGAKSIAAISVKKPSYGAYTEDVKDIPYIPEAYNTSGIKTMNLFADARLHMYEESGDLTAVKEDVFVTVANYEMFAHLLDNNDGYFAVFFGGTWCPNTQAIVYHVNELAKQYGIEKVYFFDPRLDDGVRIDQVVDGAVVENKGNVTGNLNTRNNDVEYQWTALATKGQAQQALKMLNISYASNATEAELVAQATAALAVAEKTMADVKAWYQASVYNYAFAYGTFLTNYLPTYWSEWNITAELTINGVKHTRMCVPNMMMFNGEAEGKAELIALAEAEYTWANTSVEGNPQKVEWEAAVKAVFDANPYAIYNPVIVVEESTDDSSSNSGSSNSGSSSAGDSGAC